jgi:GlpG protein
MRLLGTLETQFLARRIGDHLLTRGMRNHVDEDSKGRWQVWIEHDDHLDDAKKEFDAFALEPDHERFASSNERADRIRREQAEADRRRRRKFVDVRSSWSGLIVHPAHATLTLLIVSVVLFVLTGMSRGDQPFQASVVEALLFQPVSAVGLNDEVADALTLYTGVRIGRLSGFEAMFSSVSSGEIWRVFTPIFLHFDVLHLIFNMGILIRFGTMIEARRGIWTMLGLVLAAAFVGNVAEGRRMRDEATDPQRHHVYSAAPGRGDLRAFESILDPIRSGLASRRLHWLVRRREPLRFA